MNFPLVLASVCAVKLLLLLLCCYLLLCGGGWSRGLLSTITRPSSPSSSVSRYRSQYSSSVSHVSGPAHHNTVNKLYLD